MEHYKTEDQISEEESFNDSESNLSESEIQEANFNTLNIKPPQVKVKLKSKYCDKGEQNKMKSHHSRFGSYRSEKEKYYMPSSSSGAAEGRYLKDHLSSMENHRTVQYVDKYSSRHSHSHRKKHRSAHDAKRRYRDNTIHDISGQYREDSTQSNVQYKYSSNRSKVRKRHREHRHHTEYKNIEEGETERNVELIEIEESSDEGSDNNEFNKKLKSDFAQEELKELELQDDTMAIKEKEIIGQLGNFASESEHQRKTIQYEVDLEERRFGEDVLIISNDEDVENDNQHYSLSNRESESNDDESTLSNFMSQSRNSSKQTTPLRSASVSPEPKNPTLSDANSPNDNENTELSVPEQSQKPKIDETLPPYYPAIEGCRSVEEFQCLNHIEEGTYGVVFRAKDKRDDEIVALKRLKMEKEREGFPITSLREINTLLKSQHPNIVTVREIVVGSNMDKIFIVMDYIEHDLKSLMEIMKHKKQRFTIGEVKCLLKQLLCAVAFLHDNWILHRDLKPSNLLLSHKGILKVGDFGLAREYGSPLKAYTPIVVTLWYRAPELLLCTKLYSTAIDVWSVGCIFAELLLMNPLFSGKSEIEQINKIFRFFGTPNENVWSGFKELPLIKRLKFTDYPVMSNLRTRFRMLTQSGYTLLLQLLTYDPSKRVTAEDALQSFYFNETPLPIDPSMFPKWPAKSELGKRRALAASPKPPSGGREFKQLTSDDGFHIGKSENENRGLPEGGGFSLKF